MYRMRLSQNVIAVLNLLNNTEDAWQRGYDEQEEVPKSFPAVWLVSER